MTRLAALLASLMMGACSAMAAPSGPPPAGPPPFGPSPLRAAPAPQSMPEACPAEGEAACMLEAAWSAAGRLGPDKLDRLKPVFLETTSAGSDPALKTSWRQRLGNTRPPPKTPDYARQQAEAAITQHGWAGFLRQAQMGQAPLNIGRPEIMAAAVDLAPDSAQRLVLIDMMFGFAGAPKPGGRDRISPDDFERATFAHLLAEQMMKDCRLTDFRRARGLTSAPDSVRYALWQARIEGGAGALAGRIRAGDGTDDTRHVRQALEGYGAILKLGYCPR